MFSNRARVEIRQGVGCDGVLNTGNWSGQSGRAAGGITELPVKTVFEKFISVLHSPQGASGKHGPSVNWSHQVTRDLHCCGRWTLSGTCLSPWRYPAWSFRNMVFQKSEATWSQNFVTYCSSKICYNLIINKIFYIVYLIVNVWMKSFLRL